MRMNGKKLTALLGTAVLAMGILAGCGSAPRRQPQQGQPPRQQLQKHPQRLLMRQERQKTQKQQRQKTPRPLI